MSSQKPETIFDIERLFADINRSFTQAAMELRRTFDTDEWSDSPYVYHMPKMHLSMRLALSHSDGKVKGFFRKTSNKREEVLSSTIEVDVVAVPRKLPEKPPGE